MERRGERDSDKGGNEAAKQWGRKRESGGEVEENKARERGRGRETEVERERGRGREREALLRGLKSHYGIPATLRGRCPHL